MNEIVINPLWIEIGGPALGIGLLLGAILIWLIFRSKQKNLLNSVSVLESQLKAEDSLRLEREAAFEQANAQLVPALESLISNEISSFPLSATSVRISYDFSSGSPVKVSSSLGPIFAETADTLGKGRMDMGFNYSYLSLDEFRGLDTEDIRFTFTHLDLTGEGLLGENPNESDTIDLFLDLDVNAQLFVFFATYGLTENLDVGIAVPVVRVEVSGNARAEIDSFTFPFLGKANHNFGSDPFVPELETEVPYGEDAMGIGDVALRFKFNLLRDTAVKLGFLLDVRLPTGNEDDFLGTGETNIRIAELLSKQFGDTTVHVNFGYERRPADLDSDEFEYVIGFDHKLSENLTVAVALLGSVDLNEEEAINLAPGSTRIVDRVGAGAVARDVDLSNVREDETDNPVRASIGLRYKPSDQWVLLANVLVPLNDDGLTSDFTPTVGVMYRF